MRSEHVAVFGGTVFHLAGVLQPSVLDNEAHRVMFATTFLTDTAAVWWRSREKLRKLKQVKSASQYLSQFRNLMLAIPDVAEGERLCKFVDGLKRKVRIEETHSSGPVPMEIGNLETNKDGSAAQRRKDLERKQTSPPKAEFTLEEQQKRVFHATENADEADDEQVLLPLSELMTIRVLIAGQQVTVLKDDGCNTNVISSEFYQRNKHLLTVDVTETCISHSKRGAVEISKHLVKNATLHLSQHGNPGVDYKRRKILVDGSELPVTNESTKDSVRVANLTVKKFRSLMRKKPKNSYEFFSLAHISARGKQICEAIVQLSYEGAVKIEQLAKGDELLKQILSKYEKVFRDDLLEGLLPCRLVDNAIPLVGDAAQRPPHRALFQLSPLEMVAVKEYVTDLLRKGKGVVDYRALNSDNEKEPDHRFHAQTKRSTGSAVLSSSQIWISRPSTARFESDRRHWKTAF
eukprot:IDg8045t1